MNKTLLISTEGKSEDTFVKFALHLHLQDFGLHAKSILIETGQGKAGGWSKLGDLEREIDRALNKSAERNPFVTTMYDFADIKKGFPDYESIKNHLNKYDAVKQAESILQGNFPKERFIPYFQLHQFESLIFTNPEILLQRFPDKSAGVVRLKNDKQEYSNNPELVNSIIKPSKRIESALGINEKAFKGNPIGILTAEIGIPTLRQTCRHFDEWLKKLERLGKSD